MSVAEHLVASTRGRARCLSNDAEGGWLWGRLRENFPRALSAVLMPDHLHLVTLPGCHARLRRVLSAFTARFEIRLDLLAPEPANSRAIAQRMIRYGFLNPVRDGLVVDPWEWRWSTLRDLGGLTFPTWTALADVARALRVPPRRLLQALTTGLDYAPLLPSGQRVEIATLEGLQCAVASVLRIATTNVATSLVGRRLLVQATYAVATPRPLRLASALGCSPSTIHRARTPTHPALPAVLACLADPRLHTPR